MGISENDMQILKEGGYILIGKKLQIHKKYVAKCGVDKVTVICTAYFSNDGYNYSSSIEIPKED